MVAAELKVGHLHFGKVPDHDGWAGVRDLFNHGPVPGYVEMVCHPGHHHLVRLLGVLPSDRTIYWDLATMNRLHLAIEQLTGARQYTLRLLESIPPADWFRQPKEGVTHIAWQVGHLAMAQYRLCLDRVRGIRPSDADLISDDFLARFGRESTPDPDPAKYPSLSEIRSVFDRVHEQTMREIKSLSGEELDKPTLKPHPVFNTKIGALHWCAMHEMLHAGQIGLLRRLLGHAPIW